METLEAPRLGLVSTALRIVFGVLAIAAKLRIVEALGRPLPDGWEESPATEFRPPP